MEATNVELYTRYHRLWPFKARYLVPFFLRTNKQAKQKQTPTSWWCLFLLSWSSSCRPWTSLIRTRLSLWTWTVSCPSPHCSRLSPWDPQNMSNPLSAWQTLTYLQPRPFTQESFLLWQNSPSSFNCSLWQHGFWVPTASLSFSSECVVSLACIYIEVLHSWNMSDRYGREPCPYSFFMESLDFHQCVFGQN